MGDNKPSTPPPGTITSVSKVSKGKKKLKPKQKKKK